MHKDIVKYEVVCESLVEKFLFDGRELYWNPILSPESWFFYQAVTKRERKLIKKNMETGEEYYEK